MKNHTKWTYIVRWLYPNIFTTPLWQWGFQQCLPFSWTTLRGKLPAPHCRNGSCRYVRAMYITSTMTNLNGLGLKVLVQVWIPGKIGTCCVENKIHLSVWKWCSSPSFPFFYNRCIWQSVLEHGFKSLGDSNFQNLWDLCRERLIYPFKFNEDWNCP